MESAVRLDSNFHIFRPEPVEFNLSLEFTISSQQYQLLFRPIQKGLDYVNSHSAEEIAQVIQPQFKETDLDSLTTIVSRYKEQDTWKADTVFEEDSFDLLQNILEDSGELPTRVPYSDLVTVEFSKKAAQ